MKNNIRRKIRKTREILNYSIPFSFFEVIDETGKFLGKMSKDDALKLAESKNLDLYCVNTNPNNPLCKILDFGKFKYDKSKSDRKNKKNSAVNEIKEVRITASIDVNDLRIKSERARKFLLENKKVKISMRLKGRERYIKGYGLDKLNDFINNLSDVSEVLSIPKLVNRTYNTLIVPLKKIKTNENKKIIDKEIEDNKEK